MSSKRCPEEFKIGAVKQITENRYPIAEVSSRLGVSKHSLYAWIKRYGQLATARRTQAGHRGARHPKKGSTYFAKESR